MREFDFTPKSEVFKGTIKVRVPSYKERVGLMKELNIKFNSNGSLDLSEGVDLFGLLADKIEQFVVAVDLKCGKHNFSSIEDLSYYAEGSEVVNELIAVLMNGMSLGKS